jgi:hypothetical protein
MKFIHAAIFTLAMFMSLSIASAIQFDAGTFITSGNYKVPAVLASATRSLQINVKNADKAFLPFAGSITLSNFPTAPGKNSTIILRPVASCIDANTEIRIGKHRSSLPDVRTFAGEIVNEPGSEILLSYASGDMYGWVTHTSGARYTFSPTQPSYAASRAHTLFDASSYMDKLSIANPLCVTDETKASMPTPEEMVQDIMGKSGARALDNRLLDIEVIIETTTSFFNGPGRKDTVKAKEFIVALMNGVNALFRKELNANVVLPLIQIWTASEPDPYQNDGSDTPALLDEVANRWRPISSPRRDIVHCLDAIGNSSVGNGTFVLGIANGIGNICRTNVQAASVSGIQRFANLPSSAYNGDVVTIAHELGHNIGAAHTHNCSFWRPALDSCLTSGAQYAGQVSYSQETCNTGPPRPVPGSIMSYCHLTNSTRGVAFTFLPRVYTFLRQQLERRNCITEATNPQIRVMYPQGGQTYVSGTKELIEWTSSRVQTVKIEFSTDGGENWSILQSDLSAQSNGSINGQGIYEWTVPAIATTRGRIRVVDLSNASIMDTSWANFTIAAPALNLTTDLKNVKAGQKERVNLQWSKANVDRVKVEFSSDGGKTWQLMQNSLSANSTQIEMPDVISQDCYFRVVALQDESLISQTGPFSLGLETLALLNPVAGQSLCAGRINTITWRAENIAFSKLNVQFSVNNGASWTNMSSLGTDAALQTYSWSTPATAVSPAALLRLVYRNDTTIKSAPVQIAILNAAECSAASVNAEGDSPAKVQLQILPNPASASSVLSVRSALQCKSVRIVITDIKGSTVLQMNDIAILQGEQQIPLNLQGIPAGNYFVRLQCESESSVIPFTIQK